MIRFHCPAVPVAQPRQRHRTFAIGDKTITQNYTPTKHPVTAFKASLRLALQQVYTGPPLEGPVSLRLLFLMPRPARLIWKKRPMPRTWHAVKPDAENVVKSTQDALSGLAYRDDAQVCQLSVEKWYASGDEQPGVVVTVEEIGKDT